MLKELARTHAQTSPKNAEYRHYRIEARTRFDTFYSFSEDQQKTRNDLAIHEALMQKDGTLDREFMNHIGEGRTT